MKISSTSAVSWSALLLLLELLLTASPTTRHGIVVVDAAVNLVPFVESLSIVEETFKSNDCSVVEGSIGNEISPLPSRRNRVMKRRLLRFTTGITNLGPDNLQVSRDENPDLFEWGWCHRHYHFTGFTNYELLDLSGNDVVIGRKQAFCLMDVRKMDSSARSSQYTCSNQGITAGWADIYSYNLDGQWIDITGVPAGTYTLRVTVNDARTIIETNYDDNVAVVSNVVIDGEEEVGGRSGACLDNGSSCVSNVDCCTTNCMEQNGMRGGICACVGAGVPCNRDAECCSNRCRNFICTRRRRSYNDTWQELFPNWFFVRQRRRRMGGMLREGNVG